MSKELEFDCFEECCGKDTLLFSEATSVFILFFATKGMVIRNKSLPLQKNRK